MISRRIAVALLTALLLLGAGYAVFCISHDQHEKQRRTQPQRMAAERQARMDQRVRGYVSDAAVQSATFRMTAMEYFGGHLQEWEYADGSTVYRERQGMPGTPDTNSVIQINEEQRLLLEDILNLVVKLELWNQADLRQEAVDGGGDGYRFLVDGHNGQFSLENIDPPHLEIFRYKCWKMLKSLKDSSTGQNHNVGAEEKPALTAGSVQNAIAMAKAGDTGPLRELEHAVGRGKEIEISIGLLPVFHSLLQEADTAVQRLGLVGMSRLSDHKSQAALVQYIKKVDPGDLEKRWGDDPEHEPEYSHLMLNAGLAVQLLGEIGDPSVLPLLESLKNVEDLKKLEWAGDIVPAAIENVQSRMRQPER